MKLAIRGYVGGKIKFEDRIDCSPAELDKLLPDLARKHGDALAAHELHMIEIEFLDEPDQNQRYFRFGTDPSGMVVPIRVELG